MASTRPPSHCGLLHPAEVELLSETPARHPRSREHDGEREEDAEHARSGRHLPAVEVERVPGEPAGAADAHPDRHAHREDQQAVQPVAERGTARVAHVPLDLTCRQHRVEREDAAGDDRRPGEGERHAWTLAARPPGGGRFQARPVRDARRRGGHRRGRRRPGTFRRPRPGSRRCAPWATQTPSSHSKPAGHSADPVHSAVGPTVALHPAVVVLAIVVTAVAVLPVVVTAVAVLPVAAIAVAVPLAAVVPVTIVVTCAGRSPTVGRVRGPGAAPASGGPGEPRTHAGGVLDAVRPPDGLLAETATSATPERCRVPAIDTESCPGFARVSCAGFEADEQGLRICARVQGHHRLLC